MFFCLEGFWLRKGNPMKKDEKWLRKNYPSFTNTRHGFDGKVQIINRLKYEGCSNPQRAMRVKKLYDMWCAHTERDQRSDDIETQIAEMVDWIGVYEKPIPRKKKEKLKSNFYMGPKWRHVRYKALLANDGRCECCGRSKKNGVILHVDHIKPRSLFPELELELSNLQVLCEDCNMGKMAWDETDWRAGRSTLSA